MLIPQFTLRWMLAATTLLAVVFLVVSRAVQGSAWAVGVSAAVFMLAVVLLVHAGLFFLVWLVSLATLRRNLPRSAGPGVAATPFQTMATGVSPAATDSGTASPELQ